MANRLKKFVPIAEIASAIAVVLSLIFVGFEIRSSTDQAVLNTRALEIAAYQELMDNIADMVVITIQNPEIFELMMKARTNHNALTEMERHRINALLFLRFRHGDIAYFQYERGAIDEPRLRSALAPLRSELNYLYARNRWARVQGVFVESYRNYINQLIAGTSVEGGSEQPESQ